MRQAGPAATLTERDALSPSVLNEDAESFSIPSVRMYLQKRFVIKGGEFGMNFIIT
jgi:hypothetical protein